jgi:hypothetical protein
MPTVAKIAPLLAAFADDAEFAAQRHDPAQPGGGELSRWLRRDRPDPPAGRVGGVFRWLGAMVRTSASLRIALAIEAAVSRLS